MEVGQKIRHIRLLKGLKQTELSRKAGVSNTYLSDIELGRTFPSLRALYKLAEALDIECSTFLEKDS